MGKSVAKLTLKEKLHRHYDSRNFQPQDSSMTCFAVSVVWVNTLSLAAEGLLVLLPSHHLSGDRGNGGDADGRGGHEGYRWAQAAVVWLLAETVCQWWFLRDGSRDIVSRERGSQSGCGAPDGNGAPGGNGAPKGWRRCSVCQMDVPPRSHHCSICRHCVLKRDHHCYFSGSCVGLHNQRHFIYFLMYVFMACIYAVYMQTAFLLRKEGASYLFPPVAMWNMLTAQTRVLHFVIMVHLYLSVISVCASLGFMGWQLNIIAKGQTSYEAMKGVSQYRMRTVYANFRCVFGSPLQCCAAFLLPVRLTLPDNGLDWTE